MRIRRLAAMTATAALVLTSCGDEDPSGRRAAARTAKGGTLVAAIDSDPGHLNPAITTSGSTHTASELLYNGLVELTPDLEPEPELAKSWKVLDDGRRYVFTLRDDVTWHDGKPFTSADVVFTFEEMLLKLHSRTRASVGVALERITAPDATTVEFVFEQPYAPLLLQLDVTEAPILPKHVYEGTEVEKNPANTKPVGTGPFTFVSYQPDAEIRFARNERYFKDDLPHLDAVVLRVIPERGNQVVALEAGDVQWLFGVPGPDLERLRNSDRFDFLETGTNPGGSNCMMTVSFNLQRPIFGDVRLRRAIGQAIDREQFVERVLFGQGRAAQAPISSRITSAHAAGLPGLPSFDRAAAERTLESAGWTRAGGGTRTARGVAGVPDGTKLTFDFLHFPSFSSYAQLFKSQLAAVGVDVELVPLEPPVFADTVFKARKFDTNIISYCNGSDPEIGVRRMYTSANIGPVPFSNAAAYSNPTVDRLFDEARTTIDPAQRKAVYRRIQEMLVQDLPYLWLVETEATRVFTRACTGFSPSGHFAETASCET